MLDINSMLGAFGFTAGQVSMVVFAAALTLGLSNVVKLMLPPNSKWVVLCVLAVGVLIMECVAFIAIPPINPISAALVGLMAALISSGMWSWGKQLSGPGAGVNKP